MLEAAALDIYVSDETFAQLCAENELVRFERSAQGVLEAMPPSGGETSRQVLRLAAQLSAWSERTARHCQENDKKEMVERTCSHHRPSPGTVLRSG